MTEEADVIAKKVEIISAKLDPYSHRPKILNGHAMIDSGDRISSSGGKSSRAGAQRSLTPPIQKCSDGGRLSPARNNNHPNRKQVVLPTVKRDYEKNGLPKDGLPYDGHMIDFTSHITGHVREGPPTLDRSWQASSKSYNGGKATHRSIEDKDQMASDLADAMIKMKVDEEAKLTRESMPSTVGEEAVDHDIPSSNCSQDGHGPSHTPSLEPSQESLPSISTSGESIPGHGPSESSEGGEWDRSSSSSSDSEGDKDEEKAPIELMGEFLEAVMDEEFEVADKLCTMILLYEPENAECKQFQPLIEEMLKREREAELLGSDNDDEDDDSDSDDSDEGSDDDDEDDNDSEESSAESQEESSLEREGDMEGQR